MTLPDTERWKRISPLLDELLDLDPPARAVRLEEVRARDPALAGDLATLLAGGERAEATRFLRDDALVGTSPPTLRGAQVGAYVIESPLGQGGSGSVWRARRADGRFEGAVAIKLLHLSLVGRAGALRFEREGAILSRLTHPHIARMIDAGVSPAGQPFLVLDLVDGEPIDAWCDARRLTVEQRLALFDHVLAAVAHAHSQLVVHRDIKPSNILVAADGTVKLLDFGIAKMLEEGGESATLTAAGQRALTPQYAAPEQVQGAPVTTATDIYALGVLLYRLLVGQHPTMSDTATTLEALRATLHTEPVRLTSALDSSAPGGADIAGIAAQRGTTPARLRGELRGDLENIVDRTLRKDPAERYQTVATLAEDLRRYRAHEPVSVRRDSMAYRFTKFVRRRRRMVVAALVVLVSIAAGMVGTVTQARRAQALAAQAQLERDNALRQLSYAESSNEFITFLLDQTGPDKAFTTSELLARGERLAAQQFADDPATRARLQMHLSGLHAQASHVEKARELLAQAREAAQAASDVALQTLIDCAIAWQTNERGSPDVALAMLDASVARLRGASAGDPDRATLAECLFARGQVQFVRSDHVAAAADLQEALRMLGRPRTDQRTLAIRIRSTLALALHRTGRTAGSIAEYERIVAELEAMGRGSTQLVVALHNNLGVLLFRSGQMLRAKQASERAFEIGRSLGAPDPVPEAVYARMLADLGRPREGLPLALHALEGARASGSERVLLIALQNSAATLCAAGELVRCEAVLGEAQASMKRSTPAGGAAYGPLDLQRAELALKRGDPREARRALLHALEVVGTPAEPGETQIRALALLARIEASLGELAQANKHAAQAVALARNAMVGFDHSRWLGIAQVAQGLVQKANGDGRAAEASWRAALDELQATDGDASAVTQEARRLVEGKSPP